MKYIYTATDCPKCTILKARYAAQNIPFEEREAERIKNPQDTADIEALIQASNQNMELPIEIDWPTISNDEEIEPTRYGLS